VQRVNIRAVLVIVRIIIIVFIIGAACIGLRFFIVVRRAPIHQLSHVVDAISAVFAGLVEAQVAVNRVVLFTEVAFPIELVPRQVTAIFPFVFLGPVRIKITHSVGGN
jgi:hypothetical protein